MRRIPMTSMPAPSRPGLAILIGWIAVVAGIAAPAGAQMREVALKSGATIRAESLQRNDDRIVLDLGYTILTIPADQVASDTPSQTPGIAEAPRMDSADGPLATSPTLAGLALPARQSKGGTRESFGEMVGRLEQAVVVVSNPRGLGAGFLIDPKGLLLTNYHVVRGEKFQTVTVYLKKGGKTEQAVYRNVEVLAFSPLMDCALLQIPLREMQGDSLPYLSLANPAAIETGMHVYAIGNPGIGAQVLDHTITQGILSSTSRNFNDVLYLQTTAAMNPGNSGGPLLNAQGDVVGLVTFRAIFQEGMGFALPAWYLRLFVANARAFSPTGDEKNTGYRYHSPMAKVSGGAEAAE